MANIHCDRMTFNYNPNNIPLIDCEYLLVPADISNQINKIRQVRIFCPAYMGCIKIELAKKIKEKYKKIDKK